MAVFNCTVYRVTNGGAIVKNELKDYENDAVTLLRALVFQECPGITKKLSGILALEKYMNQRLLEHEVGK